MELVDQDVPERVFPLSLLDDFSGPVDQVVEVHGVFFFQQFLIIFSHLSEYLQETLRAVPVLLPVGPAKYLLVVQIAGLGVVQERPQQVGQLGETLLGQLSDQFLMGNGVELYFLLPEFLFQARFKDSLPLLPTIRLDELAPVLVVGIPLPLDLFGICVPPGWGVSLLVQSEVFNVDPVAREVEVGLVLPVFPGGGEELVGPLVGVPNSLGRQEVCDRELFEALHQFPVQGPEFGVLDILLVLGWVGEIERLPVLSGE